MIRWIYFFIYFKIQEAQAGEDKMQEKKDTSRYATRQAINQFRQQNKSYTEAPSPSGFIPAGKSRLLDWIDSERITFWCWLFVLHASCAFLGKQIAGLTDEDIPYKHFEVNSNPLTHNERLIAVKKYFEEMEKKLAIVQLMKLCVKCRLSGYSLLIKQKICRGFHEKNLSSAGHGTMSENYPISEKKACHPGFNLSV